MTLKELAEITFTHIDIKLLDTDSEEVALIEDVSAFGDVYYHPVEKVVEYLNYRVLTITQRASTGRLTVCICKD